MGQLCKGVGGFQVIDRFVWPLPQLFDQDHIQRCLIMPAGLRCMGFHAGSTYSIKSSDSCWSSELELSHEVGPLGEQKF